jgi:excisionase family DNA binding protein
MARRTQSRTSTTHNHDRSDGILDHLLTTKQAEPRQAFDRKVTRPAAKKREPLLTPNEVAEILKVSVKQVRRYITDPDPRKRLRSIKVGRLIRIDPFDLEDFIRDHRCP